MTRSVIFTGLASAAVLFSATTADDANAQTFGGGPVGVEGCALTQKPCGTNTPPVSNPCPPGNGLSGCGGTTPPPQPPVVNPGNPVDVTTTNTNTNTNTNTAEANADANAQANATGGNASATGGNATANGGQGGTGGSANNSINYRGVASTALATPGAGFCAGGAIGVQTFVAGVSGSQGVRMTCVDAVNSSNEVVTAIANGDACERRLAMVSNDRMATSVNQNYPGGAIAFIQQSCSVSYNEVAVETPQTYSAPYVPAEVEVRSREVRSREVPRRVLPAPEVVK